MDSAERSEEMYKEHIALVEGTYREAYIDVAGREARGFEMVEQEYYRCVSLVWATWCHACRFWCYCRSHSNMSLKLLY